MASPRRRPQAKVGSGAPDPVLRHAATLILHRHGADGPEVLMGQRGRKAAFMPSKFVFPGGALDPGDVLMVTGLRAELEEFARGDSLLMLEGMRELPRRSKAVLAAVMMVAAIACAGGADPTATSAPAPTATSPAPTATSPAAVDTGTGTTEATAVPVEAATAVPAGGTGTTAGGTIEGNTDFTGTFHLWRSGNGEPSGGCIDNETVFSNFGIHTSVKGWKRDIIVTSSTAFTIAETFYSDTTCSTVIGYNHKLYKSVTIGDAVTSMTAGTDPARPTSSKKISYVDNARAKKGNTAAMVEKIDSSLTLGTESLEIEVDGDTATGQWYLFIPCIHANGSEQAVWGSLRYDEEYVRVNGEWKFKSQTLTEFFRTPFDEGWAKTRFMG